MSKTKFWLMVLRSLKGGFHEKWVKGQVFLDGVQLPLRGTSDMFFLKYTGDLISFLPPQYFKKGTIVWMHFFSQHCLIFPHFLK